MKRISTIFLMTSLLVATISYGQPPVLDESYLDFGGNDFFRYAEPMPDGGFVVTVQSYDVDLQQEDYYLVRLTEHNEIQWSVLLFTGLSGSPHWGPMERVDDGFVVSFEDDSGIRLAKYDDQGTSVWNRLMPDDLRCLDFAVRPSGGFVYGSRGDWENPPTVFYLDAEGLFERSFYVSGGPLRMEVETVLVDGDENVYLLGQALREQFNSGDEATVVKVDPADEFQWVASAGIPGWDSHCYGAMITSDGDPVWLGGETNEYNNDIETYAWALMIDRDDGSIFWEGRQGGLTGWQENHLTSGMELDGGGFVFTGRIIPHSIVLHFDPDLQLQWQYQSDYQGSSPLVGYHSLAVDMTGDLHVFGNTDYVQHPVPGAAYHLTLDTNFYMNSAGYKPAAVDQPVAFMLQGPYPNPFNSTTTIEFSLSRPASVTFGIYSLTGRMIADLGSTYYCAGTYRLAWQPGTVASGIYLLRAELDKQVQQRKLVFVK